jgi:transposase
MRNRSDANGKKHLLRRQGALNPHPEQVTDPLFGEHDFFDPQDLVQVKYEMLRRTRIEGRSRSEAAQTFGFSRPSLYKAQAAFEQEGLAGLLPRRRGPRGAHKLNEEVLDFLQRAMDQDDSLRTVDLVQLVEQRFGLRVHPRSVERALARRQKKRRPEKKG